MDTRVFECRECGYTGPPEDIIRGFSVCPACGSLAPARPLPSPADTPAPFDRPIYRYRHRLYGPLARLLQRLSAPAIRDASDRVVAHVRARRTPARRLAALAGGALALTGAILALMGLLSLLPDGGWPMRIVMYTAVPPLVVGALALVARLSPGPDVLVVGAGRDPRLLVRIRPVEEAGATSVLDVEDAEGTRLGTLRLDRVRELVFPLATDRPLIEIEPARGPRLSVRRPSRLGPGWVFETDDGEPVGTYATNAGLLTRDALEIADPPPCDRRLFVAAMVVARP
jgi:hypothetical protein